LSAGAAYLLEQYVLQPFGLTGLRILTFILIIAALVQFMEIVIRATQPVLHQFLGVYIPLITTNCMVLGVALINARTSQSFFEALLLGLGAGLGFGLLLLMFAALREHQSVLNVPKPFQGAAINMITAGLIALGFSGLTAMQFS
jgi:electron transport complex protein RnfA